MLLFLIIKKKKEKKKRDRVRHIVTLRDITLKLLIKLIF